ncbi:MAG TPA: FtsX-like permease family protein [Candidatus Dormibacteraeota bacterium]|nr:FtsX-like permease family protein [Candidatus Dormibacteraeota bacterium]
MSLTWALAARAIRGRPLRSSLNGLAVALGIAVILGVGITVSGLDAESRSAAQASAGSSSLDVRVTAGTGLTADAAAALRNLLGVADAVPLYQKRVIGRLTPLDVAGTTVDLVALRNGSVALRPVSLVAGRMPTAGSHSEIVLDQGLAAVLASNAHSRLVALGDTVQLTTTTGPDSFTVVGIAGNAGTTSFTRSGVYVTETSMLEQFRLGLRTAFVALRLQSGADPTRVADEVQTTVGTPITAVDPAAGVTSPLGEVQPLLLLVTVLSIVVGAGATANSVALAASERRREIGLLRAAGASSRQVFRVFMLEVAIITAAAIPFGMFFGIALAALLEARLTPSDLPVPTLSISVVQLLLAALAGSLAALVGGAIPALGTGRRSILEGLRPHPGAERERVARLPISLAPPALVVGAALFIAGNSTAAALGTVMVIAGVLCALPLLAPWTARLIGAIATLVTPRAFAATRNLVRRRNRTALTLSGLTISVACSVAVSALAAGAIAGGNAWVSQLFNGDMVVRSPVAQTDTVAAAFAVAPGVRAALPLRFMSVASGSSVLAVTTIDTAYYVDGPALQVTSPARADALRAISDGPALLAPRGFASAHGWLLGTSVPMVTSKGIVQFLVAGIVDHSFPAGNGDESLIVDRNEALSYFGDSAAGFNDLDIVTTGDTSAVTSNAAQFGLSAVTVDDVRASAARALDHALALLLAVAVVALVMSMIAVVNTLTVNIRQGSRELSMMRAVGLDRAGARGLVLTEAAVLAASGAVLGVLTGCAVVVGMLRAVATPGFAPDFVFPLATAIAVVVAVVAGSIIATVVPAMRVARSSIVSAIRQD